MQMGIGFISSYLKKRGSKRLRNLMRGYRVLNHQYGLDKLDELTENLYETPFYNKKFNFSEVVFGSATKDADKIVRQFMLVSFARFKLNVSLLRSLGSNKALIFPLPLQWRNVIKSHGFAVNDFRSEVLWNFKIFLNFTYSLFYIARTIFRGINESFSGNGTALGKFVYFDSINKNNLPKKLKDGQSFDIITWYEKLEIRSKNIEAITHSVSGVRDSEINGIPLIFTQSGIPPLNRSSQIFSYTIWGVKAFLVGFVGIITCRWWHPLMLNEAAKARQVSLIRGPLQPFIFIQLTMKDSKGQKATLNMT
jgi:polysaccharide biosynthesis PFTS motif protein